MVTVPFFCPDTPYLTRNPVFMYYEDRFRKPNPFQADVVVAIDDVIEKKLDALDALESQFYEGGANGAADLVPKEAAGQAARRKSVRDGFRSRCAAPAERFRAQLREWYGPAAGDPVRYAEPFEICEYGRQPGREQLRQLLPFFPAAR
jgi:hypothetical protein